MFMTSAERMSRTGLSSEELFDAMSAEGDFGDIRQLCTVLRQAVVEAGKTPVPISYVAHFIDNDAYTLVSYRRSQEAIPA